MKTPSKIKLFAIAFALFVFMFNSRVAYAQPVEDQYVQVVSYVGPRAQFVAKPYRTSVMTFNCTVECFSAHDFNTVIIMLENNTIAKANFTGFYWSYTLSLPKKRLVKLTVILNGVEYWFELLLVKRPPTPEEIEKIEEYSRKIARVIGIRGPFNIQFLVKNGVVYVIELNLRASRSMPFTSKCVGIPLIYAAAKVMLGKSLRELRLPNRPKIRHVGVKAPVFSFLRLKGADPVLGVEMTSTGEVACFDHDLASALLKAFLAAGLSTPPPKRFALLTVRSKDRGACVEIAKMLQEMGYPILATDGTAEALEKEGVEVQTAAAGLCGPAGTLYRGHEFHWSSMTGLGMSLLMKPRVLSHGMADLS